MMKNIFIRVINTLHKRYAAGSVRDGWMPTTETDRALIKKNKPMVSRRVNALVRDMPHFGRACKILQDYTVGAGTVLQCQVRINGTLQNDINRQIEDRFKEWSKVCDLTKRSSRGGLERLAVSELAKEGLNMYQLGHVVLHE